MDNVDTCMCGGNPECDDDGNRPKCVDAYNQPPTPGDVQATCQSGKYWAYIKQVTNTYQNLMIVA